MKRCRPRYVPFTGALIEITIRTIQSRFLLRPSEALNQLIAGVLAKAQAMYGVQLHAVTFLSNHAHLLLSTDSAQEMARFMRFVNQALSVEIGKLYDWPGAMWSRRYASTPVSDEPEAQIARLKYLLANSCKEGLVLSPHDWPGIQSATALVAGRTIPGVWIDRTGFHTALKRGEDVSLEDFAEKTELQLEPLPCWRHQGEQEWRGHVAQLVDEIEQETLAMHRHDGTVPKGASAVQRVHPHQRPGVESRSPRPLFHALAREVRERMREAYAAFIAAYVEAADRLRRGHPKPGFPPGCFPPTLPFVPVCGLHADRFT